MVHEFYKNPTVGFLEFYFTKYDFPRSPDEIHFTCFKIDFEIKHGITANNFFGRIDISNA